MHGPGFGLELHSRCSGEANLGPAVILSQMGISECPSGDTEFILFQKISLSVLSVIWLEESLCFDNFGLKYADSQRFVVAGKKKMEIKVVQMKNQNMSILH